MFARTMFTPKEVRIDVDRRRDGVGDAGLTAPYACGIDAINSRRLVEVRGTN